MKVFRFAPLLALILFPACQAQQSQETIRNLDEKLTTAHSERNRLISERDRIQAENAEMEERLRLEQERNSEIRSRLNNLTAAKEAADAEVRSLQDRLAGTGVDVSRRGDVLVLDLPAGITFASGAADLNAQGRSSLDTVGAIITSDYPANTFWVEGHTDDDPIRKSGWESNLHLSAARALAVAGYLISEIGLDPAQVKMAGHGFTSPKVPNDTQDGKASNRRVEILIID